MDANRIAEIKARVEAVTPGAWETEKLANGTVTIWLKESTYTIARWLSVPDAYFIAAAPRDVRDLVDEVERLRAALKDADTTGQQWRESFYALRDESDRLNANGKQLAQYINTAGRGVDEVLIELAEHTAPPNVRDDAMRGGLHRLRQGGPLWPGDDGV